ncbi:RTA1 like protein-domain-containing protein [Cercophora newfieldiana]|uniref:RTA1 like protein-domain-containing protein n=1 Tax=Cercophora newfieldiana TaxID=92897 RepID=A0AA40CJ11_9PEZI|nr:RTA1 like protein-domain-containing protein [Cercophora newfieldiana]
MSDHVVKFSFYLYEPNIGANAAFMVLFGIVSVGHVFFMARKRTWYFIPFVIGCLFEAIGYLGRIISANQAPNFTLGPYIVQTLLILLAPALFAASIYMVLGRLIRMLQAEKHSLIRINWLTKVFVLGDVLSFLAQSGGGGILAKAGSKEDQDLGNLIVLAGLGIQVVFFGLFIITTIIFHVRIAKNPTAKSFSVTVPWRMFIWVLYFSSFLILIRSVFRMVEFGMGYDGLFHQHEAFLFALDGALMFLTCASFLWYHPGRILVDYKNDRVPSDVESSGYLMIAPGTRQKPDQTTTDDGSNYQG